MSDKRNVTGLWDGQWHSPIVNIPPGTFVAVLSETGIAISGSISERHPDLSGTVSSFVDGTRSGGRIAFRKQYDGEQLAHAVHYAGTISADGTIITGDWRFESYSGTFVMTREKFSIEELEAEREVELTDR